ncbi:MAG: NnrS family protein, partial [Campylobacterales bacterium]|nr:NnrS family protein [Campylobacterales bacterium]
LLNIVFLVALKMVPNFYAIYVQKQKWEKPKFTLEFSLILLFSLGVVTQFELLFFSKIIALIAVGFFGYIVFHLDIYEKTPAIISILVISFHWFYLGVLVYFVEAVLEIYTMKLSLHIFALGFVLNLLIGFGSRVTMGHAVPAQKIVADKFTIALFVLLQVVIVSRILGSILYLGEFNFFTGFFHVSITLWIVLFLGWSFRYGKTILRIDG